MPLFACQSGRYTHGMSSFDNHARAANAASSETANSTRPEATVSLIEPIQADWVFAYGSLMWNPEFEHQEAVLARAYGYRRSFCVRSTMYRGTPENPGIVLGLDRGGCVDGLAFRIANGHHQQAIEALYAREMVQNIYIDKLVNVKLRDGRQIRALAFVANRDHESYVRLTQEQIVQRLRGCCGVRGPNIDYAVNTYTSLKKLGVHDQHLADLITALGLASDEEPEEDQLNQRTRSSRPLQAQAQ